MQSIGDARSANEERSNAPSPIKGYPIPLSVYDVFAYFVPAITAIICVFIFEAVGVTTYRTEKSLNFNTVMINYINPYLPVPKELPILISVIEGIALICFLYALGHVIASISSLFIDRILVFRGLGYPYERILRPENAPTRSDQVFRDCIVAWFLYGTLATFLLYAHVAFMILSGKSIYSYYNYCALAILLLIFLSTYVFLIIEAFHIKGKKHLGEANNKRHPKVERAIHVYTYIARAFALGFSRLMHRTRQLPSELIPVFGNAFMREFAIETTKADTCNYWFCEMYLMENSPTMYKRYVSWHHLYSFARNLSTAFYIVFIYCSGLIIWNHSLLRASDLSVDALMLTLIPMLYLLMAFVMLSRYHYLYSCYYSIYLFRAFLYLTRNTDEGEKKKDTDASAN